MVDHWKHDNNESYIKKMIASTQQVWRGLKSAIVIMALTLGCTSANAIIVATNTDTGVEYGNFSVGGDAVLNFVTGETGYTFDSFEVFAGFNDENAPLTNAMTVGIWDPIEGIVFGQFDTSSVSRDSFGAQLVTANPFGIYVPAHTAFSILIEEMEGGGPNTYAFVGGVDLSESDVSFLGTSIVGAGFLGGDIKFTLSGSETVAFNAQADSLAAFNAAAVPEPSSYALIAGVMGLALTAFRRRQS